MVFQRCNSCGGRVEREGNYFVCESCHNKWLIDIANDIHAVRRATAWDALKRSDFEEAIELFEEIVLKEKTNHEAYWGLALAKASIVYVNDMQEGKKVPTCNNITEESFLNDKTVQMAINLAPIEVAEEYKRQAEYIDKVRVEWLKKASKEPPYDVFISFKDSDANGNRTTDSMEMQDLYTALVGKGYKVFYSRVTLRDKVADEYEPYIYNAIKTAKVMIVYGEKIEYFNSTWIKNEWSRFKKRVERGEKHKNSLVTVFKGVNPYDIPQALTGGKQAIDYGVHSNYEILLNHVKMVIDESSKLGTLETVKIEGGKIGKKSSEIKNKTLDTREVGGGSRGNVSVNDKQLLSLAETFVKEEEWDSAANALNKVLLSNPNLIEARWGLLKVKFRAKNNRALADKMGEFAKDDVAIVERVLNEIDKTQATAILSALYAGCERLPTKKTTKIIRLLLPFKSSERRNWINRMFAISVSNDDFSLFNLLLGGLESNEIDAYIDHNLEFARATYSTASQKACLENVLSVEEGNEEALDMFWRYYLDEGDIARASEKFKELLQYSLDVNGIIDGTLNELAYSQLNSEHVDFAFDIVKYYQGNPKNLSDSLLTIAQSAQKKGLLDKARNAYNFILAIDEDCAGAYWGICLLKAGVKDESGLVNSPTIIKDEPEYIKYLALVDGATRSRCIQLVKRQQERLAENQRREEERRRQERERRQREKIEREQEVADKIKGTFGVIALIVLPLIAGALYTGFMGGFGYMLNHFIYYLQISALMSVCFFALEYVIYQTYFSEDEEFNGWSKFLFILSAVALAFLGLTTASIVENEGVAFVTAVIWAIVSIIVIARSEYKETPQFIVMILNVVLPFAVGFLYTLIFESGVIVIPEEVSEMLGYVFLGLVVCAGGVWYMIYQTFYSDSYDLEVGHKFLYGFFGVVFGFIGIGFCELFGIGAIFETELPIILCVIYTLFVWYRLYVSDEKSIFLMVLIFASVLVPILSVWVGDWMLVSCFA